VAPRHEAFVYQPADKLNKILLALSPDKRQGTALINQDAFFSLCHLQPGRSVPYQLNMPGNGVYIHCATGTVSIADYTLTAGNALGVYEADRIEITASQDAELILVEVPMGRGVRV
jgi:redox-sensitive bicupin YhaK (pirin superfamily)